MTKRFPHLSRLIVAVGVLASASQVIGSGVQAPGSQAPGSGRQAPGQVQSPDARTPKPVARGPKPVWTPPRTPWGDPDIEGIWPGTDFVGVPMARPRTVGTRTELNDEEFAARLAAFQKQTEDDNAEFDLDKLTPEVIARGTVGGPVSPPPHWLERGKPTRQAGLIIDPPDGQLPPQTDEAQQRAAARQRARAGRGPADSYEDRSLYDRCITRGVLGSILPVIYNNGNQIIQAPGLVAIRNEMIHETRIVPLDGRPHVSPKAFHQNMGDSRGHWEGNTLVVETTNLDGRTGAGGNGGANVYSDRTRITERFTRIDNDTLKYEATVDDPGTWTRPWTISFPWRRDPNYGFYEYACHEGNYALSNILSGARADDRAAAAK
jgi:hypothetical protein